MGSSITLLEMFPDGYYYDVKFENKPFAAGMIKYAFLGTLTGLGPKNNTKVVVKFSKSNQGIYDINASILSQKFAVTFNNLPKPVGIIGQINFRPLTQCRVFFLTWAQMYVKFGDVVTVEDFIEGDYEKFNNNAGLENPNGKDLLLAFGHWTYIESRGKFMICDLQGVQHGYNYYLTDPAVHSLEKAYGLTDLGKAGMNAVLNGHTCNQYCQILGLPVSNRILNALQPNAVYFQTQLLNLYT